MKLIPMDEKLDNWIKVPPHTNIASCFDTFEFNHSGTLYKFSLSEMTNKGDIF
jgi:serine/threonine protein kinase